MGSPFLSRQQVHFDMLDALGVLHNAAYLKLFERARSDFWESLGLRLGGQGLDWPYYVVRNEINYHVPITAYGPVVVTVAIAEIGRTSLTFTHTILKTEETVAAEGRTVLVRIDAETLRPTPWSDAFRALLGDHLTAPSL